MAELQYPSQKMTEKRIPGMQSWQNALIRYEVKKGNQQQMKQPTMMPKVLAALVSMRKRRT